MTWPSHPFGIMNDVTEWEWWNLFLKELCRQMMSCVALWWISLSAQCRFWFCSKFKTVNKAILHFVMFRTHFEDKHKFESYCCGRLEFSFEFVSFFLFTRSAWNLIFFLVYPLTSVCLDSAPTIEFFFLSLFPTIVLLHKFSTTNRIMLNPPIILKF